MTTYFHDLQAESIVISAGNDDGTLFSIVAGGTTVFSVDDNGLLTMTGDVTLDDLTVGDDVAITGDLAVTGTLKVGTAEAVGVEGIYLSSTVAVAVPTIADAEADEVAVDVSAAFTMAPAVGDAVIAIPSEALPTACLLNGARVTGTDQVTVSFGTLEGGAGVTGANKNFKFLVVDLT